MPPSRSPDAFRVFLDRPGSPVVPWDQWIREFNLFLYAERCKDEEDRKSTLLRYLGREGRRILLSLPSPRMAWINGDPSQRVTVMFDGIETYEQMVSALNAHYQREIWWKLIRIMLYVVEALMFMQMMSCLWHGQCTVALVFAVLIAVLKAVLFWVILCVGPWGSRLLDTVAPLGI